MLLQRFTISALLSLALFAGINAFVGEAKAQFFWEKIEAEQRKREGQAPAQQQKQTRQKQSHQQAQPQEARPRGLINNLDFEPKNAQRESEYLERTRPRLVNRQQNRAEPQQAQRQQMAPGLPQTAYREQDVKSRGGGFFDWLFNGSKESVTRELPDGEPPVQRVFVDPDAAERTNNGTRMVCVRTCDGAFMPISTGRGGASDRNYDLCEAQCPGAEMKVFRMVGDQIENSISQDGEKYMSLANALKFRNNFDKTCSCRPQGKSWAEFAAGMDDPTMRKGDSVLTTEQAKRMSIAPTLRNASLRETIVNVEVKEMEAEPLDFSSQQKPIRVIPITPLKIQAAETEMMQPTTGLNPVEKLLLERNIKRHTPVKSGLIEVNDKRG